MQNNGTAKDLLGCLELMPVTAASIYLLFMQLTFCSLEKTLKEADILTDHTD